MDLKIKMDLKIEKLEKCIQKNTSAGVRRKPAIFVRMFYDILSYFIVIIFWRRLLAACFWLV